MSNYNEISFGSDLLESRKKVGPTLVVLLSFFIFSSCGRVGSDNGKSLTTYSLGLPFITPTLTSATPNVLTTPAAPNITATPCSTFPVTTATFLTCLQSSIFSVASVTPVSFEKWTKILDYSIQGVNLRYNSSMPTCWSQTPTNKDVTFTINGSTVTQSLYLSCFQNETTGVLNETQNFATGKSGDNYYYILRNQNTTTNVGTVIMAEISTATTAVSIWILEYSGASSRVTRILGDSSSHTLMYNLAATDYSTHDFCRLFVSSDSISNLYIEGNSGGTSACASDMTFANNGCFARSSLSGNGLDCTSVKVIPTNFGPSAIMTSGHLSSTTNTDIQNIYLIDYVGLGIAAFP